MKHPEWGLLIVNYLFLGGLSAGLFFLSSLATLLRKQPDDMYTRIARCGATLAPWPVMIGSLLLIFDLGRWYTFFKLFLHFRWTSPMSIGSWLLLAFNALSLVALFAGLSDEQRGRLFRRLPKKLQTLNVDLSSKLPLISVIGIPLSIAVGIYTGVLLGAVQARPFWNTNLVAQLFLFSALSTGCAALMLALTLRKQAGARELRVLYILDVVFLTLEFFVIVPYLLHGELSVQAVQDSLKLILGGPYTISFWLFFLGTGVLLPLAIEITELAPSLVRGRTFHVGAVAASVTAALVLSGGFLLRYIFVYAGQLSRFE